MKLASILIALCMATAETRVNRASLVEIEGRLNDTFRTIAADPYDLLGTARGTYIEGYGTLFTVELNLVYVTQMSPFRPAMTKDEIERVHERKLRKLTVLREQLKQQMLNASMSLGSMPGKERITMEAFLWNYNWETTGGLPHRITLSAERQKLVEAKASKGPLDFIEEQQL